MAEVKASFRPEFVNRIDEIVVFHPLGEDADREHRAHPAARRWKQRLAKLEIGLDVSEAALEAVCRRRASIRSTARGR